MSQNATSWWNCRPPGSFRLESNLTRTFVPEFLFRFDRLHKFFTGGPDAEISLPGGKHQKWTMLKFMLLLPKRSLPTWRLPEVGRNSGTCHHRWVLMAIFTVGSTTWSCQMTSSKAGFTEPGASSNKPRSQDFFNVSIFNRKIPKWKR